ncbi:immunoglobulin-like domain-containing protein [Cohnella sp. AR92]|uniref:immunoglobulin-like domain-containing protein n=1 Tax=Cohnella sp. AR92 TaxID=648716 RepID=UPI000F8F44E9|nr:immunoglobulin-like domain-containing protein [Cohnella sp. AR92]RUS43831.1 DUF5011 domain-containing protein [Cohnella sp. AR92]
MKRKTRRKTYYVKGFNLWIAILLVWSLAGPSVVSAKSASAGSRQGGTIQKIAEGSQHTLALRSDGTVVAWGLNGYGQANVPAGLSGVVSIASEGEHSLALRSDGTVAAWGNNDSGQTNVPAGLRDVIAIAGGGNHSLALKSDGTVVAWGLNISGQTSVPAGLSGVVAIDGGKQHSLALKSDGTVVAWGNNNAGQTNVPSGLSGVVAISAGYDHSLALRSDGTVVAWGGNDEGQSTVPAGLGGVVAIAAGDSDSLALKSDGTVVAWGMNDFGQSTVPAGLGGAVAIAAGGYHSFALKSDGTAVGWGMNGFGQSNVPEELTTLVKGKAIAAGAGYSLALKSDGTVAGWGNNLSGQTSVPEDMNGVVSIAAGVGHSLALLSNGTVVAWGEENSEGQTDVPAGLNGVVAIAAGFDYSLALKADGTVVGWGNTSVPAGLSGVVAIAAGAFHSLALRSDGTVVAWGDNAQGQTEVPAGLNGIVSIAAGMYHSLALRADGTVVAWGDDSAGQSTIPAGLGEVVAIAGGFLHSLALQADGTVVAWGNNGRGQTDVPAGLSGVAAIAAGGFHSLALRSNGTIVAWGDDRDGLSTVPGSAELSSLSLQEGPVDPAFSPAVTSYKYTIADSSVSSLHVTATLADPSWSDLYINDRLHADGSAAAVGVSGDSTVITIRVEPYFQEPQTYTLTALRDTTPPSVQFNTNGNASPARAAASVVTVDDVESGVDDASLQYKWAQSTAVPSDGWTEFASGDTLEQESGDGNWYLHIRATDRAGNVADEVSNAFVLDNTGPVIALNGSNPMNIPQGGTYIEPGATATDAIDGPIPASSIVISGVVDTAVLGHYPIEYTVTDRAGNIATETRTVHVYDGDAPAIQLNGSSPMTVEGNGLFTDPGATAYDLQDGDLSSSIVVTGTVDTTTLDTYVLTYDVSDAAGNAAQSVMRTVYVKDTQPPALKLLGKSEIRVTVGEAFADPGAEATDAYYGDLTGLIVVTGTVDTSKAGNYTLRYNVQDPSGNGAAEVKRTVKVVARQAAEGRIDDAPKPVIDENGVRLDPAAIDTSKPSVTLDVMPKDGKAYVSIPASILKSFEAKNEAFFIEIETPYGSYRVPVSLASLIPGLQDLLARNGLQYEDISFKITLSDKSGDKDVQAALANGLPNGQVLGAAVDFHIDILDTKSGQSIGIADTFSQALTRVIPMPKNVSSMPAQWGSFRYNETTKKLEFVAARSKQIDGTWYVMINSYSNSVYAVAENPVSFTDMQEHWSLPFVRLAAAKGLVDGVGGGRYAPDQAVTRAEFTAMLVRALGRGATPGSSLLLPYDDVKQGAWYSDEVSNAKELGLLGFASGTSFNPDQRLTREEMASMLAAAIKLEKLPLPNERISLEGYKDNGSVNAGYRDDLRLMATLQIMKGTSASTLDPKGETTRAQAAAVLIRTLQLLELIDK